MKRTIFALLLLGCTRPATTTTTDAEPSPDLTLADHTPGGADLGVSGDMLPSPTPDLAVPAPPDAGQADFSSPPICYQYGAYCSSKAQCCKRPNDDCQATSGPNPTCCAGIGGSCAGGAPCCPESGGYIDVGCYSNAELGFATRCCRQGVTSCSTDPSKKQGYLDCGAGKQTYGACF